MENDRNVWQYGYQPGNENRGYQPTASTQGTQNNGNSNNCTSSEPPKGGNVAQNK